MASQSSDAAAPVVIIFGGFTGDAVSDGILLVDSATMSCWKVGSKLQDSSNSYPEERFAHNATTVPSNRGTGNMAMLIFGGVSCTRDLNDVCVWNS